jgi:putative tricarboxylic transport membrane protein
VGVDVVFANWRGLVAPPGLGTSDVAVMHDMINRLHTSTAWHQALERNRWTDAYLPGDAFAAFIVEEVSRLEEIMVDLGIQEQ